MVAVALSKFQTARAAGAVQASAEHQTAHGSTRHKVSQEPTVVVRVTDVSETTTGFVFTLEAKEGQIQWEHATSR